MKDKAKAIAITPDGLASAAATLAIKSTYLDEHHNLTQAFWHFFDVLIEDQLDAETELREENQRVEDIKAGRELWDKISPSLEGNISPRARYILIRAYRSGHLTRPLEELTDDELLDIEGIGPIILAEIRKVGILTNGKERLGG